MMKNIIIVLLMFLYCNQNAYSFEDNITTGECLYLKGVDCSKKIINYEFGGTIIYSVYIVEGDSICDVFIYGNNGSRLFSINCKNTPILKWAFDDMANDIDSLQYEIDHEYTPIIYKLSLYEHNSQILVDSSSMQIKDSEGYITSKISELKKFIINIWSYLYFNLKLSLLQNPGDIRSLNPVISVHLVG